MVLRKSSIASATPGAAQRCSKQGFDTGTAVTACDPLQRGNRFLGPVLRKQRLCQDRHRGGIGPACFQHFRRELLGLDEPLPLQRESRTFEQLGAAVHEWERGKLFIVAMYDAIAWLLPDGQFAGAFPRSRGAA